MSLLDARHGWPTQVNAMAGAKEVTIADSEFKECKSEKGAGGGVSSMAAKTTITGTTFSENRAKGYGAALAISALGGEAEVDDCTFTKNGTQPRGHYASRASRDAQRASRLWLDRRTRRRRQGPPGAARICGAARLPAPPTHSTSRVMMVHRGGASALRSGSQRPLRLQAAGGMAV